MSIQLHQPVRHEHRKMDSKIESIVGDILKRTPQWIRHDLGAKDATIRRRAEATLAAMIASAIADANDRQE